MSVVFVVRCNEGWACFSFGHGFWCVPVHGNELYMQFSRFHRNACSFVPIVKEGI